MDTIAVFSTKADKYARYRWDYEDHPLYAHFERAARRVFDRFSTGGLLEVRGETELCLGHVIQL
jgi:hypothetical protein